MADFEVYLKSKIAEVQNLRNDESTSCTSDPIELAKIMQLKSKLMTVPYHHRGIDLVSSHRSVTNESKASVYYTPNDSVDQSHQLQSSPMHINYIQDPLDQENLNTFSDCLKPEPRCKFDFNMHRLEENLEQEIDQRRRRHTILCSKLVGEADNDDDDDETIGINSEQTRMLNGGCSKNDDGGADGDAANNLSQGYISLNTLPKHNNKFKRSASGKDLYYSLENVFDVVSSGVVSNLYEMTVSNNKTIDEASETQATSSTSENSSSNNMSRSNAMTSESLEDNNDSTRSMIVLNDRVRLNDVPTSSNSMPNIISKMEQFSIEIHDTNTNADDGDHHSGANGTAASTTANDC